MNDVAFDILAVDGGTLKVDVALVSAGGVVLAVDDVTPATGAAIGASPVAPPVATA